jgi:hypothetical protein
VSVDKLIVFEFTYTCWHREFPIRSCTMVIYAKDRKEAELIALGNNYKFFDQDLFVHVTEVTEVYQYRRPEKKDEGNDKTHSEG